MTERTNQILQTITDKITGIESVGYSVKRSSMLEWSDEDLPAVNVMMGPDELLQDLNVYADFELEIQLVITAAETEYSVVDEILCNIRQEIYNVIDADPKIGLDFVFDIKRSDVDEPLYTEDLQDQIAIQQLNLLAHYRTIKGG